MYALHIHPLLTASAGRKSAAQHKADTDGGLPYTVAELRRWIDAAGRAIEKIALIEQQLEEAQADLDEARRQIQGLWGTYLADVLPDDEYRELQNFVRAIIGN